MKLKQLPGDFVVKEINTLPTSDLGKYCAFKLTKKQWNTIDVVREIASRLGLDEKDVRYAGLKDKEAMTEQLITIEIQNPKIVERIKIEDVTLEFIGCSNRHTETEDNKGNRFLITLRDLPLSYRKFPDSIPNYFDDQRFGINKNNHIIGKMIIKKQFREACDLLGLKAEKNNYVGVLKKTGLAHLYFSAYQSYVFNSVLSQLIATDCNKAAYADVAGTPLAFPAEMKFAEAIPEKLPLVHFDTSFDNDRIKELYEEILKNDGIGLRDFAIKQFPNLVTSSPDRETFAKINDFKTLSRSDDELNKGKTKQVIEFSLPRGSYATIAVKSASIINN